MLKDIRRNPLMLTDVYNLSHERLKVNVDWEVSHIYNRAEGMILYGFNETVHSVLNTQITTEMIDEAEMYANKMNIKFPRELFDRIVDECNGYFPLEIQSINEGTWCPKGTPFAQVRNTVEGFGELVTWLESIFLHASFSCGTATEAYKLRQYLEQLRDSYDDNILIKIHSFGFRGHRSLEDAYWASTSWNLFLHGTDDFHSMIHTPNAKMGSISALAHKVTQQYDSEFEGYIYTIDATAEAGESIVAIVIDTYDADRFIEDFLVPLSAYANNKGIHLVFRPDSGDTWEQTVEIYRKCQHNNINNASVIIGEDMSLTNVKRADRYFTMKQVPLDFVSYGIGGGFYNHINRDTLGFAMKTAFSNGKPRMKFGMNPLKRSIPDKVAILLMKDGQMVVEREDIYSGENLYETIYFHNDIGSEPITINADWDETQKRAMSNLNTELQEQIVLSENINELVKEFEKIYG